MRPDILTLSQCGRRPAAEWLLGGIGFATTAPLPVGVMAVAAPQLAPDEALVLALTSPDVALSEGRLGALCWRERADLLFGHISVDEASFGQDSPQRLLEATQAAYRAIFDCMAQRGFPTLARVWNYLSAINVESHGLERYRQFNAGRQLAFAASGRPLVGSVPAACALGTRSGPLSIAFLAARGEFVPIENPRQVSAYHYPIDYGERSPTFSRAGVLKLAGGEILFVSGTAAIVGHRSLHPDDVVAQTRETLVNLRSVVEAAAEASAAVPSRLEDLDFTVYLRKRSDLPAVRGVLEPALGERSRCIYVEADVCRGDLLVEIEACGARDGDS